MHRLTHHRGQNYPDDSESLQADVMRFMAIIAFCLIAILALVKHAEPPPAENTSEVALPTEAVLLTAAEPAPALEPKRPDPEKPDFQPEALPATQAEQSEPVAGLVGEPVAGSAAPTEEPPEDPAPAKRSEPEPRQAPEPEPAPEEEGLILRFASNGDFLRLIARGDIQVYAFQETDVLTLTESYRFLDTDSPGQVYEMLPPSIPSLIVDALKQARPDIAGYRWGIALPGHISNQIEQHLGRVTSGQLVIDRYGDVHHVAAS
jgi:hypothetical protein